MNLWVERFLFNGNVNSLYKNSGRRRVTSAEIDEEIVANVSNAKFITATAVARDFGISRFTVRRRLAEKGIFCRKPAIHTAELTQAHRQKRLDFIEANYGRDWDKVIFSDEKTFLSYSDRKKYVYRPKNQRYNPEYVQHLERSGRITCGVWGFITSGGVGELVDITGRMNSAEYVSIIDDVFLPSIKTMFGENINQFSFIQDNARMHISRETQQYFDTHPEIVLLRFPPKSPDINLIENVWAKMVYNWSINAPRSRETIFQEAHQRWESLRNETQFIDNLYASIPRRFDEIIQNGGYWCRY